MTGKEKAKKGLQFKLLAILILLTLLPLVVTGYIVLVSLQDNIDAQVRVTMESNIKAMNDAFEQRVEQRAMQVSLAANQYLLIDTLMNKEGEPKGILTSIFGDMIKFDLDFLTFLDPNLNVVARATSGELLPGSRLSLQMLEKAKFGSVVSGVLVLPDDFLKEEGLLEKATIEGDAGKETRGLAIVSVAPVYDELRHFKGVLMGGEILNQSHDLIDHISETLDVTSTIFLEDMRVATSVLDEEGERVIGTRASEEVAAKVLEEGEDFTGRAQVVGEYYITAYHPLKDCEDKIVGMLYVGIPETPFTEMKNASRNRFLLIGGISLVVALAVALKFSSGITSPIDQIVKAMKKAEEGVLNQKIEIARRDEIGQIGESFNAMLAGIKSMAETVGGMSNRVAASAEDLSAAVQQSNAAMGEIASTASESVAHKAQEIADISEQAAQKGEESEKIAHGGMEAVQEAVKSMEEIDVVVKDVSGTVAELDAYSRKIDVIVNAIMEITGQTNLLAFNAAIEAARAGEQGRGFAVVADEVRILAEQSGEAAGEISGLISGIQQHIQEAVEKMDSVATAVAVGGEKAQFVEKGLREILQSVLELKDFVDNIAVGAQDQSAAAEQIAAASQEQTAVLEEISGYVVNLNNMAEELQEMIKNFKM